MDEIDVLKVIWDVSMLIRNLSEEIKNKKNLKNWLTPAPVTRGRDFGTTLPCGLFCDQNLSRFDPTQLNREYLPKTRP